MVAFVEQTCRALVEPVLPESKTTVGSSIKIKHLAPTPLGAEVHIRAQVEHVDENVIKFSAQVWDGVEKVGEADHTRVVIDIDRFLKRVAQKSRPN
jgi:predicted thioesterase